MDDQTYTQLENELGEEGVSLVEVLEYLDAMRFVKAIGINGNPYETIAGLFDLPFSLAMRVQAFWLADLKAQADNEKGD